MALPEGNNLKKIHLLTAWSFSLLAFGPALALDEASVQETVVVNAYRAASNISTSTKTDTPQIETPQSVSVVTRDELDARGVQNLNEALRYASGVISEGQGIDSRADDIYIRGFDAGSFGNNVIIDGLRAPQGNLWTTIKIDNWNMERVEVLKGPSAVLYGQVAPGGLVNQVSKTPVAGQLQQLRLGVDNYGKYQGAIDVGTAVTDDDSVLLRLVGLYSNGPTQIEHSDQQHWFIAPSAKFSASTGTQLTLTGFYQRDAGGSTFQFLPYRGTMERTAYGYINNTTFLGEPKWNRYDRTIGSFGWQLEQKLGGDWSLSQSARYTHIDSLFRTTVAGKATLTNDRILPRRAVQGVGGSEGLAADTRLTGHFETGPLSHTILAGIDWQRTQKTGLRQAANVSATAIAIDVFEPVYTNYDFASVLVKQVWETGTNNQTGLYIQDQIAYGRWRLTVSGRQDWFLDKTLDRLTASWSKVEDNAFTSRVGLLYLSDTGLSPYVSYAESFQPSGYTPGDSYSGSAFSPVTGKQAEMGVKYQPKSFDGLFTLSAYELKQQHIATADPDESHDCGSGAGSCYVETGEVRVRGIELEGRITPLPGLSVIGAVTHMDSEITKANNSTQGNDMARVPQWLGSLWIDYTFRSGLFDGLSLAGGSRYVDSTFGNTANTLAIPSYALWDAALRYDLHKLGLDIADTRKMQFTVNASNIGDRRYVATCTATTACFYGSGRTVMMSVQMGW